MRVVVGFRDLPRTGRHATDLFLRTPRTTWELNVSRDRTDGKTEVYLAKAPDYEAAAEDADECGAFIVSVSSRDCPDLQAGVDPRRDRVVATVPRACLRSPRWVRAAATAHDYGDGGPMLHDDWVPVGRPDNGQVIGPMTPRVRRDSSS